MRSLPRSIFLLCFALPLVCAAESKPNVLLIISDDQGYGDFGFNGNKLVKTPNLDRLASESAVFRNFAVAAACSPTRAALYTGRDHLLTGVWGVPPRANLRPDEARMPAFFKAAGVPHAARGQARQRQGRRQNH
jgi:arylsulfatase A-like enzyme